MTEQTKLENSVPKLWHQPKYTDDDWEDWTTSLGRELVLASQGSMTGRLEVLQNYAMLDGEIQQSLFIRLRGELDGENTNSTIPPRMLEFLGLLGERGYPLRRMDSDLLHPTIRSDDETYYRIEIPAKVREAFQRYAEARGEAHPAPPDGIPGHTDWQAAEPLPHPTLDPEAWEAKMEQIREGEGHA